MYLCVSDLSDKPNAVLVCFETCNQKLYVRTKKVEAKRREKKNQKQVNEKAKKKIYRKNLFFANEKKSTKFRHKIQKLPCI